MRVEPKTRWTLTDDEVLEIAECAKPRVLTLSDQRTPQDLSNLAWARIGALRGFDSLTVEPDPMTTDKGTFLAYPLKKEGTP